MSSLFDYLTSSAVSMTVAGNTGISPFLTLFLIGVIEKSDPELLQMDGWIESLLSSWIAIVILAILTLLEFLGKCIPVIDELIDSVEVFVVPVLSIFASLGTLGLLDVAQQTAAATEGGDGRRFLLVGDTALTFLKVVLVIIGIGLSLCIHLFKMLIRLIGLACCAGCCQPCITAVEITCVMSGVLLAIYIRQIAIITCLILLVAAGYAIYRNFIANKQDNDGAPPNATTTGGAQPSPATDNTPTATSQAQPDSPPMAQATVVTNNTNQHQPSHNHDVENPDNIPVIVLPSAPIESKDPTTDDGGEANTSATPPPATNPDFIEVQLSTSQDNDIDDNDKKSSKAASKKKPKKEVQVNEDP